MESVFFRLSQTLTGESELDEALAPGLFQRLGTTSEAADLDRLLATYEAIEDSGGDMLALTKRDIIGDPKLRVLAKMIIVLWYTGDLLCEEDPSPATEEQYFGGALWRIARAHPPGLSGGYFGHWTYPPDNA